MYKTMLNRGYSLFNEADYERITVKMYTEAFSEDFSNRMFYYYFGGIQDLVTDVINQELRDRIFDKYPNCSIGKVFIEIINISREHLTFLGNVHRSLRECYREFLMAMVFDKTIYQMCLKRVNQENTEESDEISARIISSGFKEMYRGALADEFIDFDYSVKNMDEAISYLCDVKTKSIFKQKPKEDKNDKDCQN